jgi:hypothetical protein
MIVIVRLLCLLWWIAALIAGAQAVDERNWHLLVVQIATSLIGLVLWFSVQSDSDRFRAPTFGTRWMRLALYSITLLLSIAAFFSWQWPPRNASVSASDFGILLLGIPLIGHFFTTEWKRQVTP